MIVAIIPARGGSKRIPGKNLRLFQGKPVISYSIQAALETRIFDRVIVSTDSDEIAGLAESLGAQVPFLRPAELADDHTGTDAVLVHELSEMTKQGNDVKQFCCIYPTAPLVQVQFIKKGHQVLCETGASVVISVATFSSPIFRSLVVNSNGRLEMNWPEHASTRSQDLPEAYSDAGQFYWADTTKYLAEKKLFCHDAVPVVIPRFLVQDIDTVEDWETAELMYQVLQLKQKTNT